MDIDKRKRRQHIRVIVTEVIMVLAIAGILGILLAVVSGWRVGEGMTLEQSGMVQIDSLPTGAAVVIDGERLLFGTNTSRMLTEGKHNIVLEKDGYGGWSKEVNVKPGWLLRLQYPRLFKEDRKQEVVQQISAANFLSAAPNRNALLYGGDTTEWQWVNIRGDEAKLTKVDLSGVITNSNGKLVGKMKSLRWNGNGDRVLLEWQMDSGIEWVLVDVDSPKVSINLTKQFKKRFSDIQFEAAGGDRLIALVDKDLEVLVVASKEIEQLPVKNVADFVVSDSEVIYVTTVGEDKNRIIGSYRDGEDGAVTIKEVEEEKAKVRIALSNYASERYLYYTIDNHLTVYRGQDYPSYKGNMDIMNVVFDHEIELVPEKELQVSWTGFQMVMRSGKQVVIYNTETDDVVSYEYPSERTKWLDDYALTSVENGALVVRDYDNSNVRTLVPNNVPDGYDAVVAANNRWLYYVVLDNNSLILKRERLY